MTDAEKWAAYDTAKFALAVMIGHYSELVYNESKQESPDQAKIEKWENIQESFVDQEAALSVNDTAEIDRINSTYQTAVKAIMQKG